jgi:hypothetical protein
LQRIESIYSWDRLLAILLILVGMVAVSVGLAADRLGLGGVPGLGPNQITLALSGFAVSVSGMVLISSVYKRRIGEWLMVSLGVIAVAFAADLLVVGGLPSFGAKHITLASVAFGLFVSVAIPAPSVSLHSFLERLNWLTAASQKLTKYALLVIQLALLILVIRQFQLESQAFSHNLLALTLYGFLIHSVLPTRYRLTFFLLLSLVAIAGIFGIANGAWIIGIGLALIGICHLPVAYPIRVGLLLAAGTFLAASRGGWLQVPWSNAIWPILGSMFMFRLIVYLYDLKHTKESFSFSRTLSYFFLLPNVVFPLFPVVDYSTFRRTYYDDDQYRIYQTGVEWMTWGTIHLILYRFINYYVVIAPQEVTNISDLLRYIISNYTLLLQVSGRFHLIIGILHLFGFNLPRVMREYFLATSFNDLWRRANVYWRDFMLKVFYYPAYFAMRKLGTTARLMLATILVYIVTWFLHAYQWFWLRGSFLLSAPDIAFWSIFGLLVLANVLYDSKSDKKQKSHGRSRYILDGFSLSLRTVGTFFAIAILYSLWISASLQEWFSLWIVFGNPLESATSLIPYFLVILVLAAAALWSGRKSGGGLTDQSDQPAFFRSAALNFALILFIFLIGNPRVYTQIGGKAQQVIADLRVSRLSDRDSQLLQRGYYENLTGVNQFNSDLWEIYSKRPTDWPLIQETEAARLTKDFLGIELIPSQSIIFHGERFSTNRWGMRDKSYEQKPLSDTYRAALLGPSFVMGSGVADDEVFEWLLEERLNRDEGGDTKSRYEILNFGVAGSSAIQELYIFENKVLSFEPDTIFFVAHHLEADNLIRNLADRMRKGTEMPYEYLDDIAQKSGIDENVSQVEAERRLQPYGDELVSWTYRRIVEIARRREILPVWVFIPALDISPSEEALNTLRTQAEQAGFLIVDLSDVYSGHDKETLIVAEWDRHPNAKGHQLIADQLYQVLLGKGILPYADFTR